MKKITLLALFATIFTSYSQNYKDLIKKADSSYNAKSYDLSNDFYKKAFKIEAKNSNDLYNGACASALANEKENAFFYLKLSINNGWTYLEQLKTDNDLESLHSETEWPKLIEKLKKKNDKELDTIFNVGKQVDRMSVSKTDPSGLYINDGNSTELFYYKFMPKNAIKGVLVILPSGGEIIENTLRQISLYKIAVEKGIMVIVPSINWSSYNRDAEFNMLDKIFSEIVENHKVAKSKFIIGGLSNGAMISLTYAERASKNPEKHYLIPKGIFALDAPLDEARFYKYCEREIKRNIVQAGVNEARLIKNNWDKIYGGSPDQFPEKYIENSIYSYGAKEGGNAKYLKEIPLLMFTDMDIDWLINERHRDLYDWNGIDIISMINQLKILGNENAKVIVSQGKGFRLDGTKNPHSWSIMNSEVCLNWILETLDN
ncbi:TPR end-of-group domain-containing protein [Flavobacterium sp. GT2N3]|uniref:TPR end-of-group domain-containing protein n=1 Tax=unclassified Flavobacterium TaxID=196869 RepID=UPI003AAF043B